MKDFLYRDCLIPELEQLAAGIYFQVYDEEAGQQREYFLQARMILHSLDTKGLTPFIKCEGVNSFSGCPLCRYMTTFCSLSFNATFVLYLTIIMFSDLMEFVEKALIRLCTQDIGRFCLLIMSCDGLDKAAFAVRLIIIAGLFRTLVKNFFRFSKTLLIIH